MDWQTEPDPERRGRALQVLALVGAGTLMLGSCGGMLLASYTVSGINPLYTDGRAPPPAFARDDSSEGLDDWTIDAKAEAVEAEGGLSPAI